MSRQILVVGAGIAGLACSISISKELQKQGLDVQISVFEGAPEATKNTTGGAISLTPAAQQCLDDLGVLTALDQMGSEAGIEVDAIDLISLRSGTSLGPLRFTDERGHGYGGHKGRRVLRSALSQAMLSVARSQPNITVQYDKKLIGGVTTDDAVTLRFEDGTTATGDLVLGCDGVHSATRTQMVDPGNKSRYTGISFIQSMLDARQMKTEIPFAQTAVHLARNSSFLTSFCDRSRESLFLAAIIRVNEHLVDRYQTSSISLSSTASETTPTTTPEDSMTKSIRYLVRTHFGQTPLAYVRELIDKTQDWMLYPVYQVRQTGKWHTDRVLLLGDAAHAMPPRDESAAYAIEDAILFSQLLSKHPTEPPTTIFTEYETLRRPTIDRAFDASSRLWQSDFDRGLFPGQMRDLMEPVYPPTDVQLSGGPTGPADGRTEVPAPSHRSFSDLSVYTLTSEVDHAKWEDGRMGR